LKQQPKTVNLLLLLFVLVLILASVSSSLFGGRENAGLTYSGVLDLFEQEQVESFVLTGNSLALHLREPYKGSSDVTVKLGVVGGIYDDLWASAKAALADEGIDLEIVQFSDYVTPNNALTNGDIDLNAFQHRIYLQNEIDNYGYAIQNIGNTFIIPLNLYSQKVSSIDELKDGDVVAIPDDLTNGGRALKVLEAAGLIELDPNAAFNPTVDDITSYKVNITIEELKANTIPSVLPDVAAAVVNGNYALDFGLKTDEAIYKDSVLDVEEYWNLIAARTADVEDPDTAAIYEKVVEAFQSSATEDVFNNTFGGYFIAVGWDQDLINQ
jgi:D-methionine transport system substrate-binding protein